jgi:DNA-binding Lrp family transcriptional regulator
MNGKKPLKDIELKLTSELMKNSRRSDRELARTLGLSQPTVSRNIKKLEKEGIIQEYTMIPNFTKLGFQILAMTFVKLNRQLSEEEIGEAKKLIRETLKAMPLEVLMLERGMGMSFDGVIISYHTDYTSHTEFLELLKGTGFLDVERLEVFRVDLRDEVRFLPLSLSLLAQYISTMKEGKE